MIGNRYELKKDETELKEIENYPYTLPCDDMDLLLYTYRLFFPILFYF